MNKPLNMVDDTIRGVADAVLPRHGSVSIRPAGRHRAMLVAQGETTVVIPLDRDALWRLLMQGFHVLDQLDPAGRPKTSASPSLATAEDGRA